MIDKISVSVDKKQYSPKHSSSQPSFKGLGDVAIKLVQACEKEPMVNVSVLDLSTAIIPRTIVGTKR